MSLDQTTISLLQNSITTWTFEGVTFGIFMFVLLLILFQLHRSEKSKFLIDSLFVDDIGRASTSKMGEFIALVVSTWVVVHLSINSALTYEILTVYMGAWVANRGFRHFINAKYQTGIESEPEPVDNIPSQEPPVEPEPVAKSKTRSLLN